MSKKENEREVSSLLSRLRESLKRPKKDLESEEFDEITPEDDLFERDLSDRLGKHFQDISEQDSEEMREVEDEAPFEVAELEIVSDGTLDPDEAEISLQEEISEAEIPESAENTAAEEEKIDSDDGKIAEIFSDLDALMARMTPEQRAVFEAEMNAVEIEAADESVEEIVLGEPLSADDADVPPSSDETEGSDLDEPNEPEKSEEDLVTFDVHEGGENEMPFESENADADGIFLAEETNDEYSLPDAETLRALEARMTPEQRAQLEQALQDVEETQVICAPDVSEEEIPKEETIFMVADEEEDESDMPVIKVGAEPSAFTLVDPPEPEPEEEDEEALLASLLSRMTPEQMARFREEMLADIGADDEMASECAGEDMFPVSAAEESALAEEKPADVFGVSDQSEEDVLPCEAADAPESSEEDPIEAILRDPEKLDQLMERLSPEQAEELKQALNGEFAEADEWESEEFSSEHPIEPMETIEEAPISIDTMEDTSSIEEESEMTVLWSESMADPDQSPADPRWEDLESAESGAAFDDMSSHEQIDEDDLYSMEISEDMTDDEISLMLGLGYEKELIYHLGAERVERVKMRTMRTDAQDPEFADAYAYDGEEYRNTEQNERIRYRYGAERRQMWVRLGGTAFFALLLFLYECCGVFRNAFGGIFDPAHYPVIAIMAGWQLLIFAAVFSWKKLLRGIRSAFLLEPDHHAMTAIVVAVVMFGNILTAIVFKGSTLYLYNFPAALCLLCSVLCDFADVCREELTFDVISSDGKKYAAEAIALNPAFTDTPADVLDEDRNNSMTAKNAMYVRRVGFVKNYFRRTGRKTRHAQVLNFVFLPLFAFAVVLGVVTALIGNGTVASLNTFVVTILLCMPLSYTVIHTLPLFYEARRLQKQNCAIVGESTVEESNQYSTVIFEDKELFPPVLIKTKGLKLYENNLIYSVILKISLLFREIGGPINEVLDLDKEEMQRFIASGQAGNLAEGKVELEHMTEDGVIATLSDGSCVIAGTAEFLQARGIYVNPNMKDRQLLESGEVSILYLAFDGELGARFYVDYQPDPEFEAMASMLREDGFRVAVRTLDPGIRDEMIAHKCGQDTSIHTVRATVRELTDKVSHEARVDSGLVCADDPRKMLLLFRAIRNLRRLNRFVLRLYGGALLLNMVVAIILTACSVAGYMPSLLVSLYMLVWLSTSVVLTALFLNK